MPCGGRFVLAVALAASLSSAAACGEPEVSDLRLALRDGGCSAEQLGEVSVLSVEVWGSDRAGDMCTLGKRCVFDVDLPQPASTVEELDAAISDVNQPLIDVPFEGSRWIAVIGRRQQDGCFAEASHPVCALADIADANNGELDLTLRCNDCTSFREYPLCP